MSSRTTRYSGIIDPDILSRSSALVIGLGAIGRPVALGLAQMGIGGLFACDPDTVGPENYGPQGYAPSDNGRPKFEVLSEETHILNPDIQVRAFSGSPFSFTDPDNFFSPVPEPSLRHLSAVFCCADSMAVRSQAFAFFKHFRIPMFVDARMGAEVLHLYTLSHRPGEDEAYSGPDISFPQSQAEKLPCSARSTPYCAQLASALSLAMFSRYLKNQPLIFHTCFNIPALDLMVEETPPTCAMQ